MKKFYLILIGCLLTIIGYGQLTYNLEVRKAAPQIYLNGVYGTIKWYGNLLLSQTSNGLSLTGGDLFVRANGLRIGTSDTAAAQAYVRAYVRAHGSGTSSVDLSAITARQDSVVRVLKDTVSAKDVVVLIADSILGKYATKKYVRDHSSSSSSSTGILESITTPTSGNIYINTSNGKLCWLANGYWHWPKTSAIDSVSVSEVESGSQNFALWSEQLDNAVYNTSMTIITNAANDANGNATLERLVEGTPWGNITQDFIVTEGTDYTVSFDARRGSQGSDAWIEIYDISNGYTDIINTNYFSSTSASVTNRISFNFTTPTGCTQISIAFYQASNIGDNMYLGRFQLSYPDKTYILTTNTPAL